MSVIIQEELHVNPKSEISFRCPHGAPLQNQAQASNIKQNTRNSLPLTQPHHAHLLPPTKPSPQNTPDQSWPKPNQTDHIYVTPLPFLLYSSNTIVAEQNPLLMKSTFRYIYTIGTMLRDLHSRFACREIIILSLTHSSCFHCINTNLFKMGCYKIFQHLLIEFSFPFAYTIIHHRNSVSLCPH